MIEKLTVTMAEGTKRPTEKGFYLIYCQEYSQYPTTALWDGNNFVYPGVPTLKWPTIPDRGFQGKAYINAWVGPVPSPEAVFGQPEKQGPTSTPEPEAADDASDSLQDLF